jgi:hypothetical protein
MSDTLLLPLCQQLSQFSGKIVFKNRFIASSLVNTLGRNASSLASLSEEDLKLQEVTLIGQDLSANLISYIKEGPDVYTKMRSLAEETLIAGQTTHAGTLYPLIQELHVRGSSSGAVLRSMGAHLLENLFTTRTTYRNEGLDARRLEDYDLLRKSLQ